MSAIHSLVLNLCGWQQCRSQHGWAPGLPAVPLASAPARQLSIFLTSQVVSQPCAVLNQCPDFFFFFPPLPSASCCGTSWGGQKLNFVNVFLSPGESEASESALFLCRRALPCASSAFLSLQSKLEGLAMLQGAFEVGPSVN